MLGSIVALVRACMAWVPPQANSRHIHISHISQHLKALPKHTDKMVKLAGDR